MTFDAHVLKVLIASPGDTAAARDAVERALHGWNGDRAEREQVVLLPRRWEMNAVPLLGGSGQSIINDQLVDDADIVLALFDSRVGSATPAAVSGTAEEIERSDKAGKPVHVWFSEEPISRDADLEQLRALNEFKEKLQGLGLLGAYSSPDDLAYKARQAIESDLGRLELGAVQRRIAADHAILRARYDQDREQEVDSRGKTVYKTRRQRIVVTNIGTATASHVRINLRPRGGQGELPLIRDEQPEHPPTLMPDSEFSWSISHGLGMARTFTVVMSWTEGAQEHTEEQDISM